MSDFSSFFFACMHYITLDYCEVRIFKAFELFTTYIILYFIQFAMKIASGFKHTL